MPTSCHASVRRLLIQVKAFHFFRPRGIVGAIDLGQIVRAVLEASCVCERERNLMNHPPENPPSKPSTVVYACSGCSDAGELADRIARRLTRENVAEMSCLAGIGGRVKPLLNRASAAERILAIDGCPLNCTRHTLELAGFKHFDHLELHTLGLKKYSCPVTDERITLGVDAAKKILATVPQ
jgi:uncharacterized metal-binding protein